MRIGVDIDGVLRDFHGHTIRVWNEQHPDKPFHLKDWQYNDSFYQMFLLKGEHPHLISKQMRNDAFQWWIDNGAYSDAPVLDGACSTLKALHDRKHKIVIISHQTREAHPDAALATTNWLHKNDIYYDELHYVSDKSVVRADVLIDDNSNIIKNFLDKSIVRNTKDLPWAIMFDYPWNIKSKMPYTQPRVISIGPPYWPMTLDLFEQFGHRGVVYYG